MTRARANGEGSIYPYRNGYAAYVWVDTPDGKRKRKYVYGKTRPAVHEKWIKLQEQARRGPVATTVPRLGEYLEYWLDEVVRPGLLPKPAETYAMHVRLYITPWLGQVRLDKLTVQDVRQWLRQLADACQCCAQGKDARRSGATRGTDRPRCCAVGQCCHQVLSRTTIANALAKLRTALNNAVAEELVSKNVAILAKLPRDRGRRGRATRPWSVEEAKGFLESAREDRDPFYAAYVLILVLGLRRGEVLGLTWPLVDVDGGELHVRHGLQRVGGELILGATKTEASEAPLPLPRICAAALRLRGKDQAVDKAALGASWPDPHGLVFTTHVGSPVDPRNFIRSFKGRCGKAGVRPIRVHDTRHTCGSLLAALEVHPRVAMQILRHSKINVTMEIYMHAPSELTRSALVKLGDSLEDLA